jgi:type II secretory pathway pseudopilin PulG
MADRRQRSAFTLLEAVISAAILIVVMGAGVTAVRTIEDNASRKDQITEMTALADSQINLFIYARDYIRNNGVGPVKTYLHLPDAGITATGAFLASTPPNRAPYACDSNSSSRCGGSIQTHDAIVENWCSATDGSCRNTRMPVVTDNHGFQTLSEQYSDATLKGYLVALRRSSVSSNTLNGDKRYSIGPDTDVLNVQTVIRTTDSNTLLNYDLYIVSLGITELGGGSYNPDFNQDAGQPLAGVPLTALNASTYQVDVTVTSYTDKAMVVKKSITFTD